MCHALKFWRMVVLAHLLGACASSAQPRPIQQDTGIAQLFRGGEWVKTNASGHCYSRADVMRIEELREMGDNAADVVRIVGGTSPDVRELERRLRSLRRGLADTSTTVNLPSCTSHVKAFDVVAR
jgi:hypothetical protein